MRITEKGASVIVGSHHWFDPVIGRVVSEVITEPAPPSTEKRSTDPDCGPYTHHWDFGFCHTCKKPGRDQGDAPATEKAVCPNCGDGYFWDHSRCQPAQPKPAARRELPDPTDWGPMSPETKARHKAAKQPKPAAPVVYVCPNCNEQTATQNEHSDPWGKGSLKWTCQPAPPEPAKVECPNCGEMTERSHSRYEGPGPDKWACQPAPPEPAAPEMPPMPNAVHNLVLWCQMLSASQYGQGFRSQIKADLDAFTDWWRTHAQPVAHPFKAGFKPDSMRHFAEYVRDNWHYFGTDTAGLAHQFLQEMAAQPVAVGMTEELKTVIDFAADTCGMRPEEGWRESKLKEIRPLIQKVRQQAAQVPK